MKDDWYKNESLHLVLIVRRSEWESRWEQQSVLFNIVWKREIKPKIVHHHQVQIDTNQAKHKNSFMPFGNFKSKQIIKGLEMVKPEQQKKPSSPMWRRQKFLFDNYFKSPATVKPVRRLSSIWRTLMTTPTLSGWGWSRRRTRSSWSSTASKSSQRWSTLRRKIPTFTTVSWSIL